MAGGGENGELLFHKYQVPFGDDENCMIKNGYNGKFCYVYFITIKEIFKVQSEIPY